MNDERSEVGRERKVRVRKRTTNMKKGNDQIDKTKWDAKHLRRKNGIKEVIK